MRGSYLGPKFENKEVLNELKKVGAKNLKKLIAMI